VAWINERALVDLEARRQACAERWGLIVGSPLTGGFRSAVFECTSAGGQEVVLKFLPTMEEATLEARALRAWEETGASVRLLDDDLTGAALLLERLRPALTPIDEDDGRIIGIVAEVMGRLQAVGPVDGFPDLAELFPHLARHSAEDNHHERRERGEPTRGAPAMALMAAAQRTATDLCSTARGHVLLHGDLLDKNLLLSGDRYLAVDPIPRMGEPESEVGFYATDHPPVAGIFERAALLAERLHADADRAVRWAAVWTVLQAASAWRDDQDELDVLTSSASFRAVLDGRDG
jgi:streptomycin 6-kinase